MKLDNTRIGLNRKIMPEQSLESFFKLSESMGINKVELRNDLKQVNTSEGIIDDLSIDKFIQLKNEYNINIITINAIQYFNNPNEVENNLEQLKSLCQLSNDIGNKAIIFCPEVNAEDTRSEPQRLEDAINALKEYADVLDEYNITGLIEPLGFEASTLRYPWQAIQAIDEAEVNQTFKITVDTFHFYLAHITEEDFKEKVDINKVGLVHLSGVEPIKEIRELVDADRVLVTEDDILQNIEQIELFEELGYEGNYSFEPFADEFGSHSDNHIKNLLRDTLSVIND